jgi:exocyst complex component 4
MSSRTGQGTGQGGGYGGYDYSASNGRVGYGGADGTRDRNHEPERGDYGGYSSYQRGQAEYARPPQSRDRDLSASESPGYQAYGGGEKGQRGRSPDARSRSKTSQASRHGAVQGGGRGYGPGTKNLDGKTSPLIWKRGTLNLYGATDILRVIERDWDFMKDETCIPVKVALQLMDISSLGLARQYPSFRETHQDLQYALQAIVNGMAGKDPIENTV